MWRILFLAFFIPEDKISEIKNRADIVEFISEYVILKKAGKNYVGLCPFHSEKTPSFTVSPDKQIFYCFGCGTGGNLISFLIKKDRISFPEAARILAKKYGVKIPEKNVSGEAKKRITEIESLKSINRLAMDFYHHVLFNTPSGKNGLYYLEKRGFRNKTLKNFDIGFAPYGWDNLLNFFRKKKVGDSFAQQLGLIAPKKNGAGFYDRFRNRIIFPIFDNNSAVTGFGGRVLDDSLPKYLNSPETVLYNKSQSLYGLNIAKEKCRKTGMVYIVEGYLDLLSLHQSGIDNSVATLGTSLTADHLQLLKRYAEKIVLVYDSDEAGIKAAHRCIELFWKKHINFKAGDASYNKEKNVDTRILVLSSGHDPASYISEFGADSFLDCAEKAQGVIPFIISSAVKKHGLSTEGKIKIVADVKSSIAAVNDYVARGLYVKELAEVAGINEALILESIKQAIPDMQRNGAFKKKENVNTENRLEAKIISMMLQFPNIIPEIKKRDIVSYFRDEKFKSIGNLILENFAVICGNISGIISLTDDKFIRDKIASLAIVDEIWEHNGCIKLLQQFESNRKDSKNTLLNEIKAAEKESDYELLFGLLKQKQNQAEKKSQQRGLILQEDRLYGKKIR